MSNPTKLANEARGLFAAASGTFTSEADYQFAVNGALTTIPKLADAIDRQAKLLKKYHDEDVIAGGCFIDEYGDHRCPNCREYDAMMEEK